MEQNQNPPEPQNLVEHMKILLKSMCKTEVDDVIPDMSVEFFYYFVEQTLSIAQYLNSMRSKDDPSFDPTVIRQEDLMRAYRIFFANNFANSSQNPPDKQINQINEKDRGENKNMYLNLPEGFELETAKPPIGASLQEVNFQVPKR